MNTKRVWNIISTILVALIVLIAAAVLIAQLLGIRTYAVLSGSMEPMYPTGSLLWVQKVSCSQLKLGDAITFLWNEDTVATHRIVEILPNTDGDGLRFRTKGDANQIWDGAPVHEKNVIGKPVFALPYLGYAAYFLQKPLGSLLAIGIAGVLVATAILPDLKKRQTVLDTPKDPDHPT